MDQAPAKQTWHRLQRASFVVAQRQSYDAVLFGKVWSRSGGEGNFGWSCIALAISDTVLQGCTRRAAESFVSHAAGYPGVYLCAWCNQIRVLSRGHTWVFSSCGAWHGGDQWWGGGQSWTAWTCDFSGATAWVGAGYGFKLWWRWSELGQMRKGGHCAQSTAWVQALPAHQESHVTFDGPGSQQGLSVRQNGRAKTWGLPNKPFEVGHTLLWEVLASCRPCIRP